MPVNPFKWKHYEGEIILLNVRWYLKYALSYRNLEEMMAERGVEVDHTTIMRWVHQYSPEIEKKVRRYDKNPAYPSAVNELKNDRILPQNVSFRQIKYLNNIVEQDHRPIKRIVRPMLGFQSFHTALKTLKGIEIMHMIKKGQVETLNRFVLAEVNFINKLFG